MVAITGITGRVGGIVARTLLTAKEPVRAVVRDAGKGAPWLERGCELALAEMNDAAALTAAFEAADGVFVLPPPIFDPEPGFPEARATALRIGRATPREPETYRGGILQNSWRPVRIEAVPRESWDDLFKSQRMKNPAPRVQMLDGFNEGWIVFEGDAVKGKVELETVLKDIVERVA